LLRWSGTDQLSAPGFQSDALLPSFAQDVIEHADRTWASVAAKDGAPFSDLSCVLGGDLLEQVTADVQHLRAEGKYRDARLNGPVRIISAGKVDWKDDAGRRQSAVEAVAEEAWSDQLFASDGSLIMTMPSNVRIRYLIQPAPRISPPECRGSEFRLVNAQADSM
jgi:hypothetical protein